jgi:hypothetical protein
MPSAGGVLREMLSVSQHEVGQGALKDDGDDDDDDFDAVNGFDAHNDFDDGVIDGGLFDDCTDRDGAASPFSSTTSNTHDSNRCRPSRFIIRVLANKAKTRGLVERV